MVGIAGLKIFVSDKSHGDMSLTNFRNNGFSINDSRLQHLLRRMKTYPKFYWETMKNRLRFLKLCDLNTECIFWPTLGSSDRIVVVKKHNARYFEGSGLFWKSPASYDAVITDLIDFPVAFPPADCPVIVFFDQKRFVLAQVHSGRENILKNIAGKAARAMKKEFFCDSSDIVVWFSPHLCKKCFVLSYLGFLNNLEYEKIKPAIFEVKDGWGFDMRLAIEIQLEREGIGNFIPGPAVCTLCGNENLFSHRGWSGRHPNHPEPGRFAVVTKMTKI